MGYQRMTPWISQVKATIAVAFAWSLSGCAAHGSAKTATISPPPDYPSAPSVTSCATYRDSAQAAGHPVYLASEVSPAAVPRSNQPGPKSPVAGTIYVQYVVDAQGHADLHTLRILEMSSPALAQPVYQWLTTAHFSPAQREHIAVPQCLKMPFVFAQPM